MEGIEEGWDHIEFCAILTSMLVGWLGGGVNRARVEWYHPNICRGAPKHSDMQDAQERYGGCQVSEGYLPVDSGSTRSRYAQCDASCRRPRRDAG